jgi:putative phosphoribosyl transferase
MSRPPYADRAVAGSHLVEAVRQVAPAELLVLGLPRGGVVVADELARGLGAELDVLIVRKVALPWRPELALGAVTAHGTSRQDALLRRLGVAANEFEALADQQREEVRRREQDFRPGLAPLHLQDRAVLLVDDGLATGATAAAAIEAVLGDVPSWLGLAVPVASRQAVQRLPALDALVCPLLPSDFRAVSRYYGDFDQTTDEEVRRILRRTDPR